MSVASYIKPSVGDILLHKKGGYYRVLSYCVHSETQERMVVYESIVEKHVWVRPLNMFTTDRFVVAIKADDLNPQEKQTL